MIETILSTLQTVVLFIVYFLWYFLKVYRMICYAKLTLEWFPLINPYQWPVSMLRTLSQPYFAFWRRLFPRLKFGKTSIDIGTILSLEVLNMSLINAEGWIKLIMGTSEIYNNIDKLPEN